MKFKKSMLILILAIFLLSIAGVCASDANDTAVASEDANQIDVSSNDVIVEDSLKTSEENATLAQTNDDETLSAESDSQILTAGEGTYYDLRDEIGDGGDKSLTKSYYSYTGGGTIEIKTSGIINGNGAVIDMAGSTIQAFKVSASGVTIKNLTIKNANSNGDGGAIYFSSSGTVTNCTFADNSAFHGAAVFFERTGSVTNCNFISNSASSGGAVYMYSNGEVTNCNFTNNKASNYGGAVFFEQYGSVTNCNFNNNIASGYGGAVCFWNAGTVTNCNFTNNKANDFHGSGGAVYFTNSGTATNCNFTNNYAYRCGGAIYGGSAALCIFKTSSDTLYVTNLPTFSVSKSLLRFDSGDELWFNVTLGDKNYDGYNTTINITKDGNPVGVYYALSGSDEGWSVDLSPGIYAATLSLGQYAVEPLTVTITVGEKFEGTYFELFDKIGSGGGYINLRYDYYTYTQGLSIKITKPDTVIDGNGAVIDMAGSSIRAFDVTGDRVTIKNLTIKNVNFWENGGAIKFAGNSGAVINCNFINNTAQNGGAIYFDNTGNVENCNFTNNTATNNGGAIFFSSDGELTCCNFADNSASAGVAIYSHYWSTADTCILKTGSDTTYNVNILPPALNVDNFTTVYGSGEKLTLDLKTNSSIPVTGGNISISVYFKNNDSWVGDYICLSGDEWVVDLPAGSYYAIFDTEYAEFKPIKRAINIIPNIEYYTNVTSLTTNNRTVNITAKSNTPQDILKGKILFILPNGYEINANYAGNGIWWAVHTFENYGVCEVNASYAGLDNVTINNATITINKGNSTITLDDVVLNYGDSINVDVKTEGALGITTMIDGEDVGVVRFTTPISGLDAGIHTLTVTTIPDTYYVAVTKTVNITVNKVDSTLTVDNIVFDYNSTGSATVSYDGASGVNASVIDQPNAKVNVNGNTITVSNLNAGNYTLTVTTIADANHNNITKTAKITVNKLKTELKASAISTTYNINRDLTITLKDSNGNPVAGVYVSVDLNGAKIYVTDKNGRIKLNVAKLVPKTYTAKITFKGNGNYLASSKEIKVTVKKATPKLTAKNKKFKKSIKVKKYTVTLKDNTGKAMKKVQLTIKVGKKTFKAKTNNKGKATFKIKKLSKKGKYKATVTFKGNKNYNKVTKKVKITIK